jgi:ribosomal protein L30/L7E
MHHTVEVELTPVTKGMIEKVLHLVKVEEVK